ncbi:protein TsetseEP-like [Arachis ipaensis]|uniref:protein TsetseEP-like n=1 Tax=Arachis ipaensis TaxID=130454 RepID=UPI0007AF6DF9|nr:protein TsetseEP-like [Arachis ipaensis]
MDILVLIGCVMEGKEVNFPRLIRHSMWKAHIRGLLPFPTLVTSMIELASVPWENDDVTPLPPTMRLPFHGDQEEEPAEEPTHQDALPETQATTEVQQPPEDPQPHPESQPVPVPQSEPEEPGAIVDPHPELQQ